MIKQGKDLQGTTNILRHKDDFFFLFVLFSEKVTVSG